METGEHPHPAPVEKKVGNTSSSLATPLYDGSDKISSNDHDFPELELGKETVDVGQVDVFGNEEGAEVHYKTMSWWHGAMVMIAETISLGILSLPAVLSTIGLIPGLIVLVVLGAIATYAGYTIFQFRMKYPHCNNIADVGEVFFGPLGREFFGASYIIFNIFCMASHILTFMIAMNVITGHGTCTTVFGVVGLVLFFVCSLPRTLKNMARLSIASFTSIGSAVLLTMIALGVSPLPGAHMSAVVNTDFATGFLGVANVVFAYAGHVAFLPFISELKQPREFPKALLTLQSIECSLYIMVALVVYRYAGDDVSSPALGSTGHVVRRVAYGIALPTIVIAGVIFGHLSTKYIFIRMFQGTPTLHSRGVKANTWWASISFLIWALAFIIACSIPNFSNLLGFISALLASWFSYGIPAAMWLFINKGKYFRNMSKMGLTAANVIVFCVGLIICGCGLYASGKAMHEQEGGSSWSCADNSL